MGLIRAIAALLRFRRRLHVAGDVGSGPVVVLVHGLASSSVTFSNLVPLLSDDHRVISIDILGHGGSPAPKDASYRIGEHVDWLERTIRSLKIKGDFVIVGHSLGALIVARYARVHPARIARVVLVAPPVYLSPSEIGDPFERAAMNAYLKAYEFLRLNKEFTIKRAATIARLLPIRNVLEVTENNWTAFVRSLEHSIESQTAVSDIAAIRAPVEVVYGALDQFLIPGGLRIIKNLRHVTMHRVEANDHIMRKRLAREVAAAVDGTTAPARQFRWPGRGAEPAGTARASTPAPAASAAQSRG
jgi:pimeloyl-ACP methyl ester carboxylesterase